jgi:glycosyltransferase involved in cell wall biosynthesis
MPAGSEPSGNGKISVVVSAFEPAGTIVPCVKAVLDGDYPGPFEVTVVDGTTDDIAHVVPDLFPDVRLCRADKRLFPGEARNLGLSHSTGDIVVFLDGDCVPHPDWLSEIARAHREPIAAIGGVVENGNRTREGWVSYFCRNTTWMPQPAPEERRDLPSETLSIKRWALDAYGPFLERTYCSAMAFSWKLGRAGHPPWLYPSIVVSRVGAPPLRTFFGREQPHLARVFARMRAREQGFSSAKRLAYALMSPAFPFLLFARAARRVVSHRRYVGQFVLNTPLILLGYAAWTYGEVRGYLSRSDPPAVPV